MKTVTFGEVMIRFSSPGFERIAQASHLDIHVGGSEANVAVSLAHFGNPVAHVTRLPENLLGDRVITALNASRVDTGCIARGGRRVGLYFTENGCSQRPTVVIYDREASSFATLQPQDFDWPALLLEAGWFHLSGITPALSPSCRASSLEALLAARQKGIPCSLDLNYRKNLWSVQEARPVLTELASQCDLIISNEEDAENIFAISAPGANISEGVLPREAYESVAREITSRFGNRWVAFSLRESRGASINGWAGLLFDSTTGEMAISTAYRIQIVDRVGSGDAFAAGLIHGLQQGWSPQETVDFAAAAGCLKHTMPGDFNFSSVQEVLAVARGNVSGRVQR